MLENSKDYSVGRGTDAPFEQIGADWIRGGELAAFLNSRYIPGVRAYPTRFRPTSSNFALKTIEGVRFVITNRDEFDSTRLGLEIAYALEKLYPGKISLDADRALIGNHDVLAAGKNGDDPRMTVEKMRDSVAEFVKTAREILIVSVVGIESRSNRLLKKADTGTNAYATVSINC